MIDRNQVIQAFKDFGIAERETKTYLALLEHGESKANDLHRATGLQRTKMYSILSRMVVHGLCRERMEGRSRFYSAVDPKIVLDTLRNQWRIEVKQREDRATEVLTDLAEKYDNHTTTDFLDAIEVIRNRMQVHTTYMRMTEATQKEVCVFVRPPFAANEQALFDEQIDAQRRAYDRGVVNRSIHIKDVMPFDEAEFPVLGDRDQIRFVDSLPIKMFVWDRARVMIGIPSTPGEVHDYSMILVDDPGFAAIAQIAFDHIWEQATPLETMIEIARNNNK